MALAGELQLDGKPVITALAAALKDNDVTCRREAARALGKIGPKAWPAATALGNAAIQDRDMDVQQIATASLGNIGPNAFNAVPSLIIALRDPHMQEEVVKALVKIGKGSVRDLMAALPGKRDTKERGVLIDILGQIGPDAKEAVPLLTSIAANDKYPTIRQAAKDALAKIQRKD
jgi:HEAT repeat protein